MSVNLGLASSLLLRVGSLGGRGMGSEICTKRLSMMDESSGSARKVGVNTSTGEEGEEEEEEGREERGAAEDEEDEEEAAAAGAGGVDDDESEEGEAVAVVVEVVEVVLEAEAETRGGACISIHLGPSHCACDRD